MKISFSWLQDYLQIEQSPEQIADILTEIGLEVEGIAKVESIKGSLKGLIVGEVLTCEKHPNADRLSLTNVDIGTGSLQIVCGAPNVTAGQKVVVAPVGTTLFDKEGKSWKINKGKIRGQVSEGMICAEDEIGLGESHQGILVLPSHYLVGSNLSNYYQLSNDVVFEIGLTPNRSDATSHLGVARDLAAALKTNYGYRGKLTPPSISDWAVDSKSQTIKVEVLDNEGCPRYSGVSISDVQVKESPGWLKDKLTAIGVRPINNVVDATNYVLHELGQPLHAFDRKHIHGSSIKVKTLPAGSHFTTLDDQVRTLDREDLMICDGEGKGMCIAGIFGGLGSGVTQKTTEIFLESAHFDARRTRRTSKRHLLFTDAAKIFEKGSDPNICVYALKRAALLIKDLTGGKISSEIVDHYPSPVMPVKITLRYDRLNRLVGTEIRPTEVIEIIRAMEMTIERKTEGSLLVAVPTNKVDVTREADLIEEVLRIYGFNRVPVTDRMSFRVSQKTEKEVTALRNRIADYLAAVGFHEIMGLSMIDAKYLEAEVFQLSQVETVRINNTSNVQIDVMRPNLWITALETVRNNQFRQQMSLRLFEFGKSYRKKDASYLEMEMLTITLTGWKSESWLEPDLKNEHEYYALKTVVTNILALLGIDRFDQSLLVGAHFDSGLSFSLNGKKLVDFGQVNEELCNEMDIRNQVFFAEFDWANLISAHKVDQVTVQELSKFPVVRRDLAMIVDKSITFTDLEFLIRSQLGALVREINLFDVYLNETALGEDKKSYALSILLSDKTKTFSDKEVDQLIAGLLRKLETEVGARLR